MTKDQAETAVAGSALIVGGIYAFRKLVEPAQVAAAQKPKGGKATDLIGYGTPVPVGQFITAWGFVYLILALVTQATPNLGGGFAILVATGDILGNGVAVADDVQGRLKGTTDSDGLPSVTGALKIPQFDPSKETSAEYDQRLFDWNMARVRQREIDGARRPTNPLVPGNPLAAPGEAFR